MMKYLYLLAFVEIIANCLHWKQKKRQIHIGYKYELIKTN